MLKLRFVSDQQANNIFRDNTIEYVALMSDCFAPSSAATESNWLCRILMREEGSSDRNSTPRTYCLTLWSYGRQDDNVNPKISC